MTVRSSFPTGSAPSARGWARFIIRHDPAGVSGGHAVEYDEAGRFRFDVAIAHPWTGPIVRYRGWLDPRGGIGQGEAGRPWPDPAGGARSERMIPKFDLIVLAIFLTARVSKDPS
jgi:hypothetical protein